MTSLTELIFDFSPDMMLLVDPMHLNIIRSNRAARETLGYAETDLLTKKINEIESALPDVFYWEDVVNGHLKDIVWQEGLYQCADGSLVTVKKSVTVIQHENKKLMLLQARDASSDKQFAEMFEQTLSQLRATLEATGNGILVLDWQGRISNMNHLFSTMWRVPEDLLSSQDDAAILRHIREQVCNPNDFNQALQELGSTVRSERILVLNDGRIFECKSRPQYQTEQVVGRVYGFDDITEQRRAAEELIASRQQLEERVRERTLELTRLNEKLQIEYAQQADLMKKLEEAQSQLLQSEKMASIGQLAAGVAHEINNPVGFVNSNLGTMQNYVGSLTRLLATYRAAEASLADDQREEINRIKQEIDVDFISEDIVSLLVESLDGLLRVKRIVQDLKNFSHVDKSEFEWANLENGLDSTLNVVWNELKYKATVAKEYRGLPQIKCLPSQLNQVFLNLMVNASHAIDQQGEITIRTDYDEKQVWIEVADTGRGISPENLGRIFDPFFTTKPIGQGTGLGLSLSYRIVQKHHGRIEVSSQLGVGTTFRVVLPRDMATEN